MRAAQTGQIGDGKIFVTDLTNVDPHPHRRNRRRTAAVADDRPISPVLDPVLIAAPASLAAAQHARCPRAARRSARAAQHQQRLAGHSGLHRLDAICWTTWCWPSSQRRWRTLRRPTTRPLRTRTSHWSRTAATAAASGAVLRRRPDAPASVRGERDRAAGQAAAAGLVRRRA